MHISGFVQGSVDWLESRIGVLTGTRIKKILTPAKLGLAKGYEDTILSMIDENITGISNENTFKNADMERGTAYEPAARCEYVKLTGNDMIECGLCFSEKYPLHALSPDGFTPDFIGATEIKCPAGNTHLRYLSNRYKDSIYNDYKLQCINYFIVNPKLQWLDTVSYRPEFYPCPIHIERINRTDIAEDIATVSAAIDTFFETYNELFLQLTF